MPVRQDTLDQPADRPPVARHPLDGCVLPLLAQAARHAPVGDLSFVAALLAAGRSGMALPSAPFVATPGGQY